MERVKRARVAPAGRSTRSNGGGASLGSASERKQASVFFADICESTRNFAADDPEEARSQLEPALRTMCEAVAAYGGIVSQLLGDGVLALFGAPVAQEDHALRACLAAVDLHRRVRMAAADGVPRFDVRIGIDSGELAVGAVHEYNATYYRADGSPLHSAKRLEQHAPVGGTLIGAATMRLVQGQVEVLRELSIDAKGFDQPLSAYEIELSAVAPLARRRELAPLIGREAVLQVLTEPLARVRAGHLHVVGLRGEAGIGKSRLALALSERLAGEGFATCWLTARAYRQQLPCDTIAKLAATLLVADAEGTDGRRDDAVRAAIEQAGDVLAQHHSALADLLDLGEPGAAWDELSPALRRRRLTDALLAIIDRRLARGPLLIVIDDLFHIDRESQRLLESVLRRLEHAPLLLCGTYRPEFAHRFGDAPWFTEYPLGPLDSGPMDRMADAILGSDPGVRELSSALVERAGGNPFFLEQMAMALVDDGTLLGDPGAYRCTRQLDRLKPPASISSVVAARVDRMPATAKTVLECAAVLGEPLSADRLAPMAAGSSPEVETALRQACSSGLLVEAATATAAGEPGVFGFRHSLVQEVVAASLSRPRRRQLHRAAYDVLRGADAAASAEDAALLTQHAYAGEAWPEAAECAVRAMVRAIGRSANRDALNLFALGLDAISRPGQDEPRMRRLELSLRMAALAALSPLGKMDEAVDNLDKAHAITRQLGDLRRESGVALQLAFVLWVLGQYERGLEAAAAAQASAQRTAEHATGRSAQMAAQQARMMLRHGQGRYRETLADARRVEQEFPHELATLALLPRWATIPSINVHVFSADSLAEIGDFAAAQTHCDAAYRELQKGDHPYSHILLDWVQGSLWLEQGWLAEALNLLEDARRRCRVQDVPTMEPPILARQCVAMARLGQVDAALALIERAIDDQLDRLGGRYNAYYFPASHATVLLEAGRFEAALAQARTALREAQRYGQRGYQARAALLLADVAARAGEAALAAEHYALALALAAECGMAAVEAQAARGLQAGSARSEAARG